MPPQRAKGFVQNVLRRALADHGARRLVRRIRAKDGLTMPKATLIRALMFYLRAYLKEQKGRRAALRRYVSKITGAEFFDGVLHRHRRIQLHRPDRRRTRRQPAVTARRRHPMGRAR